MRTPNRCLRRAIKRGNRTKILMILDNLNVNLKALDRQGNTVLHHVLKNENLTEGKQLELLKIFLDRGANANVENSNAESVLRLAIAKRLKSVIDFLIKHNGPITDNIILSTTYYFIRNEYDAFWGSSNANDESTIRKRESMENESPAFVEWLILRGFNFDRKRGEKFSALHYALKMDLLHVVPIMLKYTKDKNYVDEGETLLHAMFRITNWFLRRDEIQVNLSWYNEYRLRYALEIVKILLDQGASPVIGDRRGSTPVSKALNAGEDVSIIEMLVNHVPDGENDKSLASRLFFEMVRAEWSESRIECYMKILVDLVARGADVNYQDRHGRRPVHQAVRTRNVDAVEFLKAEGADFSVVTSHGDNSLHILTEKYHGKIYRENAEEMLLNLLVVEGCQVNAKNDAGNSPLHLAAESTNFNLVQKLIKNGAEVNCKNKILQTSLHCAAKQWSPIDVIRCLLDEGAEVNSQDIRGCTPLHLAVTGTSDDESRDVLRLLWERGAYLDVRDNKGDTALAMAMQNDDRDKSQELLELGADFNDPSVLSSMHNRNKSVLVEHCLKLKAAELPYPKSFSDSEEQKFYNKCLREIEVLKATFIDSCTSLYQLLHMNSYSRCIHINNEKLKSLLDSHALEENFPKYSTLILASYREAVTKKSLLEPAKEVWLELTNIALPDICLERILGCLSNKDLVAMIEGNYS